MSASSSESDPDEEVPLSLAAALAANEEWLSGQRLANALEDESRARSDFAALTAEVTEISRTLIKRDAWDCPEDRSETRARIEALEQEVQRAQDLLFHYEAEVVKAKAEADAAAKKAAALAAAVEEKARQEDRFRALLEAGLCVIGSVCHNAENKLLDGFPFCVECYKHAKANGAVVPSGPLSRKALYQLGGISELDYSLVEPDKPYSAVVGSGSSAAVQTAEHDQQALTERQKEVLDVLREKEDKRQRQADHAKRLEEEKAEREDAAPGRVKHVNNVMLTIWDVYQLARYELAKKTAQNTQQEQNALPQEVLENHQKEVGAVLSKFLLSDQHAQQAQMDACLKHWDDLKVNEESLNPNVVISMLYSPELIMWMIEFLANYVGMISTTTEKAYAEMQKTLEDLRKRRKEHFDGNLKDPLEEAKFLRMILVMMLGFMCKFTVNSAINENAVWNFSIYFLTDFLGDESVAAIQPAVAFVAQGDFESASKALKTWMLELTLNVATRLLMEANVHQKSLKIFLHKKVFAAKTEIGLFVSQMKDLMEAHGMYVPPESRNSASLKFAHHLCVLWMLRGNLFANNSRQRIARRELANTIAKLETQINALKSEILTLESSCNILAKRIADLDRQNALYSCEGAKERERAESQSESANVKLMSARSRLRKMQDSLAEERRKLSSHDKSARAAYVKAREQIRDLLVDKGDGMVISSTDITELFALLLSRACKGRIELLDEKLSAHDMQTLQEFAVVSYNLIRTQGDSHAGNFTAFSESGRSGKSMTVYVSSFLDQPAKSKSAKASADTFETRLTNVFERLKHLACAGDGLESINLSTFEDLFEHLRVAGFHRQDAETIAGFIRDAISKHDFRAVDKLKNLIVQVESKQLVHQECMGRLPHLRGGEHC
jgi:hypothetical protein